MTKIIKIFIVSQPRSHYTASIEILNNDMQTEDSAAVYFHLVLTIS